MKQCKIDFDSIPWENPAVGVRFKAYQQGGKKLRLAEFGREFIEPDWCTKGHIGYVLEGQMDIDFDGKVVALAQVMGFLFQRARNTDTKPKFSQNQRK